MKRGLISIEKLYSSTYNSEYVYVELEGEVYNINVAKQPLTDLSRQNVSYGTTVIYPERILKDSMDISHVFSVVGTITDANYENVGATKATSTITADYSATATTIVGTDLSAFPSKFGLVKIDDELIHYITRSTNTLTIPSYGRGYGYSIPTYHNNGATITNMSETALYKYIKLENMMSRGGLNSVNVREQMLGHYKLTQSAALKLSAGITATATTIGLNAVTGLSASGLIRIDDEIIYYTAISTLDLTTCIRGYGGSTASAHAINANVLGTISQCPRTDMTVNGVSKTWGCLMTKFQPQVHRKSHQGRDSDFDAYDVEMSFVYGREP